MLEEREGEHRHEGVAVHAGPGPALEAVGAEFLLQLLVRLLAPAGPGRGERRRAGRGGGRRRAGAAAPAPQGRGRNPRKQGRSVLWELDG